MKCLDCDRWMKRITKDLDGNEIEPYWKCISCGCEIEDTLDEYDIY